MPIQGECPACGKPYRVPDEAVGKIAACPACKTKFAIEAPKPASEAGDPPPDDGGYQLADEPVPAAPAPRRRAPKPMDSNPAAAGPSVANAGASQAAAPAEHDPFALATPTASTFVPAKKTKKKRKPSESADDPDATGASWSFPGQRHGGGGPTSRRYLWFAVALVPLVFSLVLPTENAFDRLVKALEEQPDLAQRLEDEELKAQDPDDPEEKTRDLYQILGRAIGDGKLPGAHLSRNTWMHWVYAAVAAVGMFMLLRATLPLGNSSPVQLACVALAVAVGGVFLLFTIQHVAAFSLGIRTGRGIFGLVFGIFKLIGFAYYAAVDPKAGFALSLFGFTLGVGLCEELSKSFPVILHFRGDSELDWQAACAWGAACGLGFGVAEGIHYSSDFYNGIETWDMYLVRFVSCVALHAIWSATVGILTWQNQALLEGELDWMELGQAMLYILGGPIVLHGLYDTFLKKGMPLGALAVALASFGLLAAVIELNRQYET